MSNKLVINFTGTPHNKIIKGDVIGNVFDTNIFGVLTDIVDGDIQTIGNGMLGHLRGFPVLNNDTEHQPGRLNEWSVVKLYEVADKPEIKLNYFVEGTYFLVTDTNKETGEIVNPTIFRLSKTELGLGNNNYGTVYHGHILSKSGQSIETKKVIYSDIIGRIIKTSEYTIFFQQMFGGNEIPMFSTEDIEELRTSFKNKSLVF